MTYGAGDRLKKMCRGPLVDSDFEGLKPVHYHFFQRHQEPAFQYRRIIAGIQKLEDLDLSVTQQNVYDIVNAYKPYPAHGHMNPALKRKAVNRILKLLGKKKWILFDNRNHFVELIRWFEHPYTELPDKAFTVSSKIVSGPETYGILQAPLWRTRTQALQHLDPTFDFDHVRLVETELVKWQDFAIGPAQNSTTHYLKPCVKARFIDGWSGQDKPCYIDRLLGEI